MRVSKTAREDEAPAVRSPAYDDQRVHREDGRVSGEDGGMVLKFQSKELSSVNTSDVPEFNVEGIFRDLALQDYERAVGLARGFQGEGPRAVATIAIARAVLEPKKAVPVKN